MITHGTRTKRYTKEIKGTEQVIIGFYLVLPGGDRHWFGANLDQARRNFEDTCNKHLSEKDDYQYWVDYCHGYDVHECLAWANIDQTNSLI